MRAKIVWSLASACAVATTLFALHTNRYQIDDAWITYRYAENLASGVGFVYNLGERVLGTSTPLYTLILALARLLGWPPPETSLAIGWLCVIATIIVVFHIGSTLRSDETGLLAAAILILSPAFHDVVASGMETSLYLLLISATFLAYARGRILVSALLAVFCALTRLDGLIVWASIVLVDTFVLRRPPIVATILYGVLLLPWAIFSQLYFGHLMPQSFLAKHRHSDSFVQWWMLIWITRLGATPLAIFGALAEGARSRPPAVLILILWSVLYAAAFVFSNMWSYPWYFAPLWMSLSILAALGVSALVSRASLEPVKRLALTASLVAVTLISPHTRQSLADLCHGRYGRDDTERVRWEAAGWIGQNVETGNVIGTPGIGMVGYRWRGRILDMAGLVSPEVMIVASSKADMSRIAVTEFQPTYVFADVDPLPDYMTADYVLVKDWGHDSRYGRAQFRLLRRIER